MLRKVSLVSLIVLIIVLFASCVNNKELIRYEYTLKGQSGKWSAEMRIVASESYIEKNPAIAYTYDIEKIFTLNYMGEVSELANAKKLVYTYEGNTGQGKSTVYFDTPPVQTVFRSKGGGNLSDEKRDSIIQVKVELDGEITEFQLTEI